MFRWLSILYFTYLRTSVSKTMTKNRNMTMETISVLFLVSRSDVSQPRNFIPESNAHAYVMWIKILRVFKMKQLLRIVDRKCIKIKDIFKSDLLTSSSTSSFKNFSRRKTGNGVQKLCFLSSTFVKL